MAVAAAVVTVGEASAIQAAADQPVLEEWEISSFGNASALDDLHVDLHSIHEAIQDTISRSAHNCPEDCDTILRPICLNECKRRWLARLPCLMVCSSSELMCCRCPFSCHGPFQECYASCSEDDTRCKDKCIAKANRCCSVDRRY